MNFYLLAVYAYYIIEAVRRKIKINIHQIAPHKLESLRKIKLTFSGGVTRVDPTQLQKPREGRAGRGPEP